MRLSPRGARSVSVCLHGSWIYSTVPLFALLAPRPFQEQFNIWVECWLKGQRSERPGDRRYRYLSLSMAIRGYNVSMSCFFFPQKPVEEVRAQDSGLICKQLCNSSNKRPLRQAGAWRSSELPSWRTQTHDLRSPSNLVARSSVAMCLGRHDHFCHVRGHPRQLYDCKHI